jgi:acyl carrier protein
MQEFIKKFEDAIDGSQPGDITPDTNFRELGYWDSLSLLSILAMIDIDYNKQLTVEDLKNCITVKDLYDLIIK